MANLFLDLYFVPFKISQPLFLHTICEIDRLPTNFLILNSYFRLSYRVNWIGIEISRSAALACHAPSKTTQLPSKLVTLVIIGGCRAHPRKSPASRRFGRLLELHRERNYTCRTDTIFERWPPNEQRKKDYRG